MQCCARCGREVYKSDRKLACNKVWHAFCFSCCKCGKLLDPCTVNPYNGEIFCRACYQCLCHPYNSFMKPDNLCKVSAPPCQCTVVHSTCDPPHRPPNVCRTVILRTRSKPRNCSSCRSESQYCKPPDCLWKPYNTSFTYPYTDEHAAETRIFRCGASSPGCYRSRRRNSPRNSTSTTFCCSAPIAREISNYYNRNHECDDCASPRCQPKSCLPKTCQKCSGPESKYCGSPTSFGTVNPCDPHLKCCSSPKTYPPATCYSPTKCYLPPKCYSPTKYCSAKPFGAFDHSCDSACQYHTNPCSSCSEKPVCYPPVTRENKQPGEIICFQRSRSYSEPKCCRCGIPVPCKCQLENRRRMAIYSNAPRCRRCGHKAYAAERVQISGNVFHNCCFSCYCCHKPLDMSNAYENQGEIHCKTIQNKFKVIRSVVQTASTFERNTGLLGNSVAKLHPVVFVKHHIKKGVIKKGKDATQELVFLSKIETDYRDCYNKYFGIHGYGYGSVIQT